MTGQYMAAFSAFYWRHPYLWVLSTTLQAQLTAGKKRPPVQTGQPFSLFHPKAGHLA